MALSYRSEPIAALYRAHSGWLCAWLLRRMGCREVAADVAQDTFVRVLGRPYDEQAMREPRAFLTTIAKRLMIDRARRQAVEQAYLAELAILDETAGAPSPEEILLAVQALTQIAEALERVPPKAGEAFLLHYLDGWTHAQVAEELGVSARMVRKYLAQCLVACALAEPT